jgi:hypothetical protein
MGIYCHTWMYSLRKCAHSILLFNKLTELAQMMHAKICHAFTSSEPWNHKPARCQLSFAASFKLLTLKTSNFICKNHS